MYPKDNVFNIYYNIGKRLPFIVKRSQNGLRGSYDEDYRYSKDGRTFMVERIEIHNKIYGKAYGYCMIDGIRDDDNEYMQYYEKGTVPCAGCGGWVLIDIPGVDINEVFPLKAPDYVLQFGKYKGKTLADIYKEDKQYLSYLVKADHYFRIDFTALMGINSTNDEALQKLENEIAITPKNIIKFGKYKGKTYESIFHEDPQYIKWFMQNNYTVNIDYKSFESLFID
jgi:uncharacterized protein (DUF3820 family)